MHECLYYTVMYILQCQFVHEHVQITTHMIVSRQGPNGTGTHTIRRRLHDCSAAMSNVPFRDLPLQAKSRILAVTRRSLPWLGDKLPFAASHKPVFPRADDIGKVVSQSTHWGGIPNLGLLVRVAGTT